MFIKKINFYNIIALKNKSIRKIISFLQNIKTYQFTKRMNLILLTNVFLAAYIFNFKQISANALFIVNKLNTRAKISAKPASFWKALQGSR